MIKIQNTTQKSPNKKLIIYFQALFVILIPCLPVHGRMRRNALTPSKEARRHGELRLPADLRSRDIPKLRIPNTDLCNQLKLDPAQHYVVLPWWYQHCQDHKEKKLKKVKSKLVNFDYYMNAIKRANAHKKLAKKREEYRRMLEMNK